MNVDQNEYPAGETLGVGRFVFRELLAGAPRRGVWRGEQLFPVLRDVLISIRHTDLDPEFERGLLRNSPGVASVLFLGSQDGYQPPSYQTPKKDVAVIEVKPSGLALSAAERLSLEEAVCLGVGLCDTILACGPEGALLNALRPETVFVTGTQGSRRFAGVTPRSYHLVGDLHMYPAFSYRQYRAPGAYPLEHPPEQLVYSAALLLWFGLLGTHPYTDGREDEHNNMYYNVRAPFTGPPELGRLLEAVLVADPAQRMPVAELRGELERLLRSWSIELPRFPPPGLEGP